MEAHKRARCLVCSVLVALIGCVTGPKQASVQNGGLYGPPGPSGEPGPAADARGYGPQLPLIRKIVVVLGPGMARNYAVTGFFRTLEEEKIPIAAVYGSESGALMAALFSKSANVNEFEWDLMKFKDEALVPEAREGFSLSRLLNRSSTGKELQLALSKAFGNRKIENSRVPVRICVAPPGVPPVLVDSGPLALTLHNALAPGDTEHPDESCATRLPFPVQAAKESGLGGVVVFDVMTPKTPVADDRETHYRESILSGDGWQQQLALADVVIHPDLDEQGYFDFSKKSTSAYLGAQAAHEALPRLKALIDIPTGTPP